MGEMAVQTSWMEAPSSPKIRELHIRACITAVVGLPSPLRFWLFYLRGNDEQRIGVGRRKRRAAG